MSTKPITPGLADRLCSLAESFRRPAVHLCSRWGKFLLLKKIISQSPTRDVIGKGQVADAQGRGAGRRRTTPSGVEQARERREETGRRGRLLGASLCGGHLDSLVGVKKEVRFDTATPRRVDTATPRRFDTATPPRAWQSIGLWACRHRFAVSLGFRSDSNPGG